MQLVGREEIVCWFLLVSQVSVIMLGGGGGWVMWSLPMMRWTALYSSPPHTKEWPSPSPHHWRPVQTCSLDLTVQTYNWYWHLVATQARTVGKRAVRTLLKCFLVIINYHPSFFLVIHSNRPNDKASQQKTAWHLYIHLPSCIQCPTVLTQKLGHTFSRY